MKFLIKIEEAIDSFILSFIEKMKKATPHFIFDAIDWVKHTPDLAKKKSKIYAPKVRILFLKVVGYSQHYVTLIRGHIVGVLIYVRSEEFKKRDKKEMVIAPLRKFKTDPVQAFSVLLVVGVFSGASYFIYKNTEKIIVGTKALRAPASAELEDPILEFKKLKYTVLGDKELNLDVVITAKSVEDLRALEHIEKDIEEHLLGITPHINQLPPTDEEIKAMEAEMMSKIEGARIKSVEIKQVLPGRPKYYMQTEKLASFKDINLQLFLEDTRRNRQIWVDFTALSSNRNIILFLKDHEIEVRDYINMHVEPVIPQLPIEEEGRQIIKDKIKLELNEYLKKSGIEGKILEIYVDYLIVS